MAPSTDRARWQALCLRSSSAHSSFVYGVTTTRIFCRPTCPARLARRANVVFFNTATDAARAGFRACKRCKPEAIQPTLEDQHSEVVRQACQIMQQSREGTTPGDVAKRVGLSYRYFHSIFKQAMGFTPAQYAKRYSQRASDFVDSGDPVLSYSSAMADLTVSDDLRLFDNYVDNVGAAEPGPDTLMLAPEEPALPLPQEDTAMTTSTETAPDVDQYQSFDGVLGGLDGLGDYDIALTQAQMEDTLPMDTYLEWLYLDWNTAGLGCGDMLTDASLLSDQGQPAEEPGALASLSTDAIRDGNNNPSVSN
ncbi:hypothetical protein F4809DRAFT_350442 [Biscogniauxia mediterranea]|nr:hypothetical protein F4809DRAFT_350442 [Biscogniauxia mediterranea]